MRLLYVGATRAERCSWSAPTDRRRQGRGTPGRRSIASCPPRFPLRPRRPPRPSLHRSGWPRTRKAPAPNGTGVAPSRRGRATPSRRSRRSRTAARNLRGSRRAGACPGDGCSHGLLEASMRDPDVDVRACAANELLVQRSGRPKSSRRCFASSRRVRPRLSGPGPRAARAPARRSRLRSEESAAKSSGAPTAPKKRF